MITSAHNLKYIKPIDDLHFCRSFFCVVVSNHYICIKSYFRGAYQRA